MVSDDPEDRTERTKKSLEERKKYFEEWKQRHEEERNAAPFVQRNLELTNWQLDALNNRPDEASEIPLAINPYQLDLENQYIRNALPLPPRYSLASLINTTSVTTSGSADFFEYVNRVGDIGTDEALAYSQKYTNIYSQLQNEQDRPRQVRELLEKLGSSNLIKRFDIAQSAYMDYKVDRNKRSLAAAPMRTFLDGLKGDLFDRAQGWLKENMTWELMAVRLVKGVEDGLAHRGLLKEQENLASLYSRLSDVLKDREGGSVTNLDNIWVQLLDHVYAVLGYIDFEKEIPKRG